MQKNFQEFLRQFPHISVAEEKDNAEILAFYHQTELQAKESAVIYKRGQDFFAFLKARSEKYIVILLRDDDRHIRGMGVLSYRPGYINGEAASVGYLGDLRIALNRKLIREWRAFYSAMIENSPFFAETLYCRYYQTAIIKTNSYSLNNLVETKIPNLFYKEFIAYKMVNIVGSFQTVKNFPQTSFANTTDKNELLNFLETDHKKRQFGHQWKFELERQFNERTFVVTRNSGGKIISSASTWNPIASKQIMITKVPGFLKPLAAFAKCIPGLRMLKLPVANEPLQILYLGQMSFAPELSISEKRKMLLDTIRFLFLHTDNKTINMISYCDFDGEELLKQTPTLFKQTMNMALYTVHTKESDGTIRDELIQNETDPTPAFDIALV